MGGRFIESDRDQMYLMPPSLREWLPEDDLAWFMLDAVEQMDLSAFYEGMSEDGAGRPGYEPRLMVTLLLYSYCLGERSSRRIERLCRRDVGYRVIAANLVPDHTKVCRFRKEHRAALEGLFVEALRLCREAGLVKVGFVALDGTKVKGNASLSANRTEESIREEVRRMLAEAEAVDAEEAATGKRKRGRNPKEPDEIAKKQAKANLTDPESRIMKTRSGFVQGYNAQAVVTEAQVILAAEVTQEENDVRQLHPMLARAAANLAAAGEERLMEKAAADAGYFSAKNLSDDPPEGPELFIATTKDWKRRKAMRDAPPPRGRIPRRLSLRERMERELLTLRGRAIYRKRSRTVEPVFGQIKDARRADRFLLRRITGASLEWKLLCLTHNLLKLFGSGKARWSAPAAQAA